MPFDEHTAYALLAAIFFVLAVVALYQYRQERRK